MFLRKSLVFLMIFLVISSATAARKTKRPVKPAKTFPRTNVTPSPQPSSTSTTTQQAAISTTSSTAAPPQLSKTENLSVEETDVPGNVMQNDNELPKPLESVAAANSGNAQQQQMPQESKTEKPMAETGNGMIEEECDPDMIGFEIITG